MYKGLPIKLTREEYEHIAARAGEELLVPGVKSVYLLGDAWKPGVSDMDLLVICEDNRMPRLISPWALGAPADYIFTHRYLTMSDTAARKLFYLFPIDTTHARLISGEPINFEDPREILGEGYVDLIAPIFFDLLVTKLLPMAGTLATEKEVDVRLRIGALYSLRYSETLLSIICGYRMPDSLREHIVSLRDNWFNRPESESLELLEVVSKESISLIMDMMAVFATYSRKHYGSGLSGVFANRRYRLVFGSAREDSLSILKKKRVRKKVLGRFLEHDTFYLPQELSVYLSWYAAGEGLFSEKIRSAWKKVSAPPGAAAHIRALNRAFEDFVRSKGAHKIPYAYGFSPSHSLWRDYLTRAIIAGTRWL